MIEDEHLAKIVSMTTILILCFTVLLLVLTVSGWRTASPALAYVSNPIVTISPSSGPVGATIQVNGSSLAPDATTVTFGYSSTISDCSSPAPVGNPTSVSNGSFSGSFTWPSVPSTGSYTVCVTTDGADGKIPSSSPYEVLSTSPPQVSMDKPTYTVGKTATVSGSNFLPGGSTKVYLAVQPAGGGTIANLANTSSDSDGTFSQNITLPKDMTGSVKLIATSGGSSPTLSASVTFTVNAAPRPTPTPTPKPTATATATPTATDTPTAVPVATDTPVVVPSPTVGQTSTAKPATTNHPTSTFPNIIRLVEQLPYKPIAIGLGALIGLGILFVVGRLLLHKYLSPVPEVVVPPSGAQPWSRINSPNQHGGPFTPGPMMPWNGPFPPGYSGQPGWGPGNAPMNFPQESPFPPTNNSYPSWEAGNAPGNVPQVHFPTQPLPANRRELIWGTGEIPTNIMEVPTPSADDNWLNSANEP